MLLEIFKIIMTKLMDVAVQGYLNVGPLKEILILTLCDGELRR